MENALNFSGKVVLVTGGGKGVGKGITECFLAAGADVVICGRSAPATLPQCDGREALFTLCDVRDYEQIEACVAFAVQHFGRLDVLVNNAGGAPFAAAATASPRFSESIIRLNLSTIRPSPGTAAYGAAKAGLVNLGTSLAVEWAPKVRVNALVVGLTETEQAHLHYGDKDGIAAVGATIPLGRMAVPTDVGNACLFLASKLASYVSGTNFAVHGGGEKPAFLNAANVKS